MLNAEDLNAAREELLHPTTTAGSATGSVAFTTNANNRTAGWLTNSYKELKDSLPAILADKTEPSVMAKKLLLPGVSNHNYISIGIYDHPCNELPQSCKPYPGSNPLPPSECDNKTGLPWEPCDGIRNQAAISEGDAPSHGAMVDAVVMLGLGAYYSDNVTETNAYVSKAKQVIETWFLADATAMLPNLYYGQIMPREGAQAKGHGGFIEWAHTAFLLDHFELLRFAAARDNLQRVWTPAFDNALRGWWTAFEAFVEGKDAQGTVENECSCLDLSF